MPKLHLPPAFLPRVQCLFPLQSKPSSTSSCLCTSSFPGNRNAWAGRDTALAPGTQKWVSKSLAPRCHRLVARNTERFQITPAKMWLWASRVEEHTAKGSTVLPRARLHRGRMEPEITFYPTPIWPPKLFSWMLYAHAITDSHPLQATAINFPAALFFLKTPHKTEAQVFDFIAKALLFSHLNMKMWWPELIGLGD